MDVPRVYLSKPASEYSVENWRSEIEGKNHVQIFPPDSGFGPCTAKQREERTITDNEMKYLGEAIQSNTSLERLSLSNHRIGSQGIKYLSHALERNTTLTSLCMDHNRIESEGIKSLCEVMKKNNTLTELNLSANSIGPKGVQYLVEVLDLNKNLRVLDLSCNDIGEDGIKILSAALINNTSLKKLILSKNTLGPKGIMILSQALAKNQGLEALRPSSDVNDKDCEYLARALEANTTLKELDLACKSNFFFPAKRNLKLFLPSLISIEIEKKKANKINYEGARKLAEALEKNHTLTELNLNGNPMKSSLVGKIFTSSPLHTISKKLSFNQTQQRNTLTALDKNI